MIVFAGLTVAFALADWLAIEHKNKLVEYIAKPATIAALIGVAATIDTDAAPGRRTWIIVALVFCMAGDVFLMLPTDKFVQGLASFLVGHFAYVVAFTRGGGSARAALVAAAVVIAVVAVVGRFVINGVGKTDPKLIGPVISYMVAIAAMVTLAAATGNVWAIVGAGLFMFSDSLIAINRFVKPMSWAPLAIIVTYHLGQAGLVASLMK